MPSTLLERSISSIVDKRYSLDSKLLASQCGSKVKMLHSLSYKRPRSKNGSWINTMYDDLFNGLFSYLPQNELCLLATVAQRWKEAVMQRDLWSAVDISKFHEDKSSIDDVLVALVRSNGTNIENLSLRGCSASAETLKYVFAHSPNIKMLDISNCREITDELVEEISQMCPQLEFLKASQCRYITDVALSVIGNRCHNLKRVFFDHCRLISSSGVASLLQGCPEIKELSFNGCPKVSNATLLDVASFCRQIEVLHVGGSGKLMDSGLHALAKHCFFLSSLDIASSNPLGRNVDITDRGVIEILRSCKNIKSLSLNGCSSITLSVLFVIAECCSGIEYLDLGGCRSIVQSNESVDYLLSSLRSLKYLSLWDCSFVTDSTIKRISEGCPNLTTLDLDGCELVTSSSVNMLKKSPSLKSLYIHGQDHAVEE